MPAHHSRAASSAVGAAHAVGSTAQIRSGRKRAAAHRHGTTLLMANDNRCKIRVRGVSARGSQMGQRNTRTRPMASRRHAPAAYPAPTRHSG